MRMSHLRPIPLLLGGVLLLTAAACSTVGSPPSPGAADPGAAARPAPRPPIPEAPRGAVRTPVRAASSSPALSRLPGEVRALWVVRTTLSHPDSIRAMVQRAARAGFNTLIVQVRGRGDAYYRSRWEPRPPTVDRHGSAFDPLALTIREAHQRGLQVHAWVNGHLVGGMGSLPTDPAHLIAARPDLLGVPRRLARELFDVEPSDPRFTRALLEYARGNQDRIEGIYTAPSHPEVKEHLYSVWMDLLESYDLDGLHFDYIRYPNPDFDYSRAALERFRLWVSPRLSPARSQELERAWASDPLAYVEALPGPWDEFRRVQITELVERIYHGVKKRRPEALVSAAVFANAEDAFRSRFQDWRGWVQNGILDVVAPMAYTPDNEAFRGQIRGAVEAVGANRVWAGIGVYRNSYQGTLDKIGIGRELGARGMVLFSYDWAVREGEGEGSRSFLDRVGAAAFGVR